MTLWQYPMKPVRVTDAIFSRPGIEDGYVLEPKFDGWRAMVVSDESGRVSLWTREKRPIEMPNNLRGQLESLGLPRDTVLDGEIWNPTKRGSWQHSRSVECLLTVWDAVRIDGEDLSQRPLEERYAALRRTVGGSEDVTVVRRLPATRETVESVRSEAVERWRSESLRSGFIHGVVLKRLGSPRRDHCSRCVEHSDWMKIVFFPQN